MLRIIRLLGAMFCALWGGPCAAETLVFQVRLSGVPVGKLEIVQSEGAGNFNTSAKFRTTGLAGVVAKVKVLMESSGTGALPDIDPAHYREDMHTGFRSSQTNLRFGSQDSRVDPMSALYMLVGTRPEAAGCAMNQKTWDGTRQLHIQMNEASRTQSTLVCNGYAARQKGYDAKDLERAAGFPGTVTYERRGTDWVATKLTVTSVHGPLTLLRR